MFWRMREIREHYLNGLILKQLKALFQILIMTLVVIGSLVVYLLMRKGVTKTGILTSLLNLLPVLNGLGSGRLKDLKKWTNY